MQQTAGSPAQPDQPTPPASQPPVRPRLRLHPVSLVLALVTLGAGLSVSYITRPHDDMLWVSSGVGRFCGALMVSVLFGVLGYFLSRRSSRVFNVVTCVFLTLSLLSSAVVVLRHRGDAAAQQAARGIEEAGQHLNETVKKNLGQPNAAKLNAEAISDVTDSIDAQAATLTGDGAVIFKVSSAVIRSVTEVAQSVGEATDRFAELGGIDAASIRSLQDITDRLAQLDVLSQRNRALAERIRTMPEEFRAGLINAGFDKTKAGRHRDQFAIGADIPRQVRSTVLREASIKANGDFLNLLKDLWGKWTIKDDQILLDDDAEIQRLSAALERAQAAEKAESDALKAILDARAAHPGGKN